MQILGITWFHFWTTNNFFGWVFIHRTLRCYLCCPLESLPSEIRMFEGLLGRKFSSKWFEPSSVFPLCFSHEFYCFCLVFDLWSSLCFWVGFDTASRRQNPPWLGLRWCGRGERPCRIFWLMILEIFWGEVLIPMLIPRWYWVFSFEWFLDLESNFLMKHSIEDEFSGSFSYLHRSFCMRSPYIHDGIFKLIVLISRRCQIWTFFSVFYLWKIMGFSFVFFIWLNSWIPVW